MIADEPQFEAAMTEALALLAAPPAEGQPGYDRLMALMAEIAAFRPTILTPTDGPAGEHRARLKAALGPFETRLRQTYRTHWLTLIGENFLYK